MPRGCPMNHRMRVAALVALPAALLAAGCGAGDDPGPTASATVPALATIATSSAPTASPTPSRTTQAPLAAADGRRLKACRDGTCAVIVKTGDQLPNAGGQGPAEITVRGGDVTISTVSASGFASTLTGGVGNVQQFNDQVFVIVAVAGGRAVLRLSKR